MHRDASTGVLEVPGRPNRDAVGPRRHAVHFIPPVAHRETGGNGADVHLDVGDRRVGLDVFDLTVDEPRPCPTDGVMHDLAAVVEAARGVRRVVSMDRRNVESEIDETRARSGAATRVVDQHRRSGPGGGAIPVDDLRAAPRGDRVSPPVIVGRAVTPTALVRGRDRVPEHVRDVRSPVRVGVIGDGIGTGGSRRVTAPADIGGQRPHLQVG